ncbi:bacterial group 2 Ig-like protein [Tannerella forsythia 92A2]|uniref:Bacterial group 2 Ig-like protein n=2 Tax=Tannerella forsythia TaxID=28112 RepID=G8ULX5_TANFA|nr:bacterial group 2 Ig-like protein [Tannerella forsythia 92A2]
MIMTRIKQISIWLIALIGLITALGAAAQNSGNTGPLRWEYNAGTNTLSITGTGAMPNYASTNDQPWKAFQSGIKTVIIGDNVTTIGERAFAACNALQNVTLGSRVQTIEVSAFGTCQALQSISFPASVTTIGKRAFLNCRVLQNVSFSDGLTTIGEGAFSNCVVLQSITLPASVTTIGEYAFAFCKALQQVTVAWDTPLAVPDKTFWGVNTANVPLKVPKGKEAEYQAAPVWKSFKINSPPVPGNGGKLTVTDVTSNGFTVSWEKATDSETPQEKLIYKVYCKGGGGLLLFKPTDLKATLTDKASYTITGLGGGITIINPALDKGYDVNVEVEDEAGSSAWYNEENVKLASATVAVTGVTVAPAALTLEVGQTGALTATVAPATATNKAVTWTSSAPAIATVDASGTVKGIAPGTATITVKTADGGKTATCAVTVKAAAAPAVKVTGITLNYSSITVNGDLERVQLIATVAPATATDQSLTWTSSDASVASVDGAGLVTIRKKGKATVTAKANDGSGVSASCLFDVIRTVANETIDGLRIYAADGALRLALPAPETVHIYNVEGSLVKTLILPAGDHVQPLPSGVYVVRVGERVTKVMVK